MEFVNMEERHLDEIEEMERACFSMPWSRGMLLGELRNPLSRWIVAESGGRVLGYVGCQTTGEEAQLMNLAVAPDFRRGSIGTELMHRILQFMENAGVQYVTLEVRKSNEPAIHLYKRVGFWECGIRPRYYFHPNEDAVIMRKELKT